jgi:hypothetical protein
VNVSRCSVDASHLPRSHTHTHTHTQKHGKACARPHVKNLNVEKRSTFSLCDGTFLLACRHASASNLLTTFMDLLDVLGLSKPVADCAVCLEIYYDGLKGTEPCVWRMHSLCSRHWGFLLLCCLL